MFFRYSTKNDVEKIVDWKNRVTVTEERKEASALSHILALSHPPSLTSTHSRTRSSVIIQASFA